LKRDDIIKEKKRKNIKKAKSKYKRIVSCWICKDCHCEFTEPENYKQLKGVERCPFCGSESISELKNKELIEKIT
jgi:hypothetical protein